MHRPDSPITAVSPSRATRPMPVGARVVHDALARCLAQTGGVGVPARAREDGFVRAYVAGTVQALLRHAGLPTSDARAESVAREVFRALWPDGDAALPLAEALTAMLDGDLEAVAGAAAAARDAADDAWRSLQARFSSMARTHSVSWSKAPALLH